MRDIWTTNTSRSSSMTAAELAATVESLKRKYDHLPIAVLASERAIAAIRKTVAKAEAEVERESFPFSIGGDARSLFGIPVYLDRRLKPGEWKFAYSWAEIDDLNASGSGDE